MSRTEHYRFLASKCLNLAQLANDPTTKTMLLEIAQTWMKLAEQMPDTEIDLKGE